MSSLAPSRWQRRPILPSSLQIRERGSSSPCLLINGVVRRFRAQAWPKGLEASSKYHVAGLSVGAGRRVPSSRPTTLLLQTGWVCSRVHGMHAIGLGEFRCYRNVPWWWLLLGCSAPGSIWRLGPARNGRYKVPDTLDRDALTPMILWRTKYSGLSH